MSRARLLLAAWSGAAALLAACQVELRRIDVREERLKALDLAIAKQAENLTVENEDGTITLNSPRPEHLIAHLRQQIAEGNADLIHDQLLAQAAKQAYAEQNLDSREAAHWLIANQRDVLLLLGRMAGGLSSPDVISQSMDNGFRLRLSPDLARSFRFTTLDILHENGQFKLLLIS